MSNTRFLASVLVAVALLTGVSGCTVASSFGAGFSRGLACAEVKKQIGPAEISVKAHLGDARSDPPVYEAAMTKLANALTKAGNSTKNTEVAAVAKRTGAALSVLISDFTTFETTKSAADYAKVQADGSTVKTASAAYAKVCNYEP